MDLRGSHGNFPHFSLPSESFESLLLPPRSARLEVSVRLTSNLRDLQPALLLVTLTCRLLPPRSARLVVSVEFTFNLRDHQPALLLVILIGWNNSGGSVARFSALHFQGYFIRQVSCYTLLSGFRLP